jgi:hypothetical protein
MACASFRFRLDEAYEGQGDTRFLGADGIGGLFGRRHPAVGVGAAGGL